VLLELSEPGGCAALGEQSTATLTIRNDGAIIPVPTFTVGGSVAGLEGTGLVIEEATTGARVMPEGDGDFTFDYQFPQGTAYNVRIASNPTNPIQTCWVNNPAGTVAGGNVSAFGVGSTTELPTGSVDVGCGEGCCGPGG